MKRTVAILLSLLLFLSTLPGYAEETTPAKDFPTAFLQWAQNLNLSTSDYGGTFSYGQNPPYHATLRQDNNILELAIQELGKAQLNDQMFALEINGQKYYVDLVSLLQFFQSKANELPKDLEILQGWLQKAYQQIILPCIEISYTNSGMILHIEINDEGIKDRTYALVDELLEDRSTVEHLLTSYGPLLSLLIPNMPKDYNSLIQVWTSAKNDSSAQWPFFSLTADVTFASNYYGGLEISCNADIKLSQYAARLTFELLSDGNSLDLTASYKPYSFYSSSQFDLEFHYAGNQVDGQLIVNGTVISLNVLWEDLTDGTRKITADLTGNYAESYVHVPSMHYHLDVCIDPKASTLKANLTEMKDTNAAEKVTIDLASLDIHIRNNSWDAVLNIGDQIISAHFSNAIQYSRLKIDSRGRYGSQNYLDLWIYHPGDSLHIKLDTDLFTGRQEIYDLNLQRNKLSFDIVNGYRQIFHTLIRYQPTNEGFTLDAELMDYYILGPNPCTFRLSKNNQIFYAELRWDYWLTNIGFAEATLELDEKGRFGKLEANASISDDAYTSYNKEYHLSCTPDTLIYEDPAYYLKLQVKENTAHRLNIGMYNKPQEETGSLLITLDDSGALEGVLSYLGEELARLRIEPIEKEPITPISKENALIINQETLMTLLTFSSR